jgi:hypothetical protein
MSEQTASSNTKEGSIERNRTTGLLRIMHYEAT